MIERVAFYRS